MYIKVEVHSDLRNEALAQVGECLYTEASSLVKQKSLTLTCILDGHSSTSYQDVGYPELIKKHLSPSRQIQRECLV
jgi:hypothetical protein